MKNSNALNKQEAIALTIALINQGKIELSCLKKFNEFRDWELNQSRPDIEKFNNFWGYNLSARRNDLCRQAATLDAEYLKTFITALTSDIDSLQEAEDAWHFVNTLREIRDKIELNSLEKPQS